MGVYWKIRLLGEDLEKPIYRGHCPKKEGLGQFVGLREVGLGKKEGGEGTVDTLMPAMIILSHLKLSRIDLPRLNSSNLMEIVTIPVG